MSSKQVSPQTIGDWEKKIAEYEIELKDLKDEIEKVEKARDAAIEANNERRVDQWIAELARLSKRIEGVERLMLGAEGQIHDLRDEITHDDGKRNEEPKLRVLENLEYQSLAIGSGFLSCRYVLETSADRFREQHKDSSLCLTDISKFSTSKTLEHVEGCDDTKAWNDFLDVKKESEESASIYSKKTWKALSKGIHNHITALNSVVYIPDCLSHSEKRFLFRLLRKKEYTCEIMVQSGGVRKLKAEEMNTPPSSPETAPQQNPDFTQNKKIKLDNK